MPVKKICHSTIPDRRTYGLTFGGTKISQEKSSAGAPVARRIYLFNLFGPAETGGVK